MNELSGPQGAPPSKGRVAVIAVHGVADQLPGETAQAIGAQLAAAAGGITRAASVALKVKPVDPVVSYKRWLPRSLLERGHKSLLQSLSSDFLDDGIGEKKDATRNHSEQHKNNSAHARHAADTGVRFTDYLLAKAEHARTNQRENVAQLALINVDGPGLSADVYEMYWADLSRLSAGTTRIVAELFTLLFHLSRLGSDALALAAVDEPRLRSVRRAHRAADWMFSRVLAPLSLQLLICALVLAPALLAANHREDAVLFMSALVGAGAVSAWFALGQRPRPQRALAVGLVLGCACFAWLGRAGGQSALPFLMSGWLLALCALYYAFMRYCEQRFRAVSLTGGVFFALTLFLLLGFGTKHPGLSQVEGWITGSLFALEGLLLAHAFLWPVLAFMIALSVLLAEVARLRGAKPQHRQALGTAVIGLFTSVGAFLVCLMVCFALSVRWLSPLLGKAVYASWYFSRAPLPGVAGEFLAQRMQATAAALAPISLALLALIGFMVVVFAPSVLRELRVLAAPDPEALGQWLTRGYRFLEGLLRVWGWFVALGASVIAVLLLSAQSAHIAGVELSVRPGSQVFASFEQSMRELSRNWLSSVVYLIGGGAAALLALGHTAARRLRALRGPLDAALDVDNHFREFPRHEISRVRIVERYIALLEHLRDQRYERVVIIAHSQGTVVTADLLRYLQHSHELGGKSRRARVLGEWLKAQQLALLTVGSPLRQLYALRFPDLYGWVLEACGNDAQPCSGPRPGQLGVSHWVNLWCAGDYVGRWLWSSDASSQPSALSVGDDVYTQPAASGQIDGSSWKDCCVAADAHTHYFDLDQQRVAEELLALIRQRPESKQAERAA
jgi:hypothetical protein